MSKTKKENAEEQVELTAEEMAQRKKELIEFYSEEIPLLEKRVAYEELITKIEEAKFARFQIQMAKAQILSPQYPEEGPFETEIPEGAIKEERKLKTI